jgi:hypothetical protein
MDVASAPELRRLAKKEPRRRTARRMLALANALDGMSRAEAARAAGIERQSLREAVVRFNTEGLAGLIDRSSGRRPERLTEGGQAVLVNRILRGPDPERRALKLDAAGSVPLHRDPVPQAYVSAVHVARGAPPRAVEAERPARASPARRQSCRGVRKGGSPGP